MQHRYAYQLSPRMVRIVCFLGGPIVLVSAYAIFAGWGLSLQGVVDLTPGIARLFWTCFGLVGLAILGWGTWNLKIGVRYIEIDSEGVTVPTSMMSKDMVKVPFGQIQGLNTTEYNGAEMLHIAHGGGTSKLESPHFESFEAFNDLADRLHDALQSRA